MMKTLYINRHAKSSWDRPYDRDFDRTLNKRGEINAAFMSERFAKEVEKIHLVSSPAKRAISTAIYFAKALNMGEKTIVQREEIYGASVEVMMKLINGLDDSFDSVILFGHNPTFTDLAASLDHNFNDHLVTCARVKIEFEVDSWQYVFANSGAVRYLDFPKKYPEMDGL